jgi:hypothetical protein
MRFFRNRTLQRWRDRLLSLRWMLATGGLAAAACGGASTTTPGGQTGIGAMVADGRGGLWVVAQGDGAGLYRSADTAKTFQPVIDGDFDTLAVSLDGTHVFVADAVGNTGSLSRDSGRTFAPWPFGATVPAFDPLAPDHLVVAADGPEVSWDGGQTFTRAPVDGALGALVGSAITADGTVWVFGQGIAVSHDAGLSFQSVRSTDVSAVRASPSGVLWVQPADGQCDDGPAQGFCELGAGGSLSAMPIPGVEEITLLGADTYVGVASSGHQVLARSMDNGQSFALAGPWPECPSGGEPLNGTADPRVPGLLYLGGTCLDGTALWVSENGARTFTAVDAAQIVAGN